MPRDRATLAGQIAMKWLTIRKFAAETGYSEDAIRSKIERGEWLEGHVWKKAPDGRVLINVEGFESWVENNRVFAPVAGAASR